VERQRGLGTFLCEIEAGAGAAGVLGSKV
jgi:hypothetical protein